MGIGAAFSTGVSGMNAFAAEVSNISDNLANSNSVGYKRVDTTFKSFITRSTLTNNDPGGVLASPTYRNTLAGNVVNSDNSTSFAVAEGVGFVPTKVPAFSNGVANFDTPQHYTRAADFTVDDNGYLVNSSGEYLMGMKELNTYQGDIPSTPALGGLVGVRVDPTVYRSVPGTASTVIDFNANFPAGAAINTGTTAAPSTGSYVTSQVQFYDSVGNARTLQLTYIRSAAGTWDLGTGTTYGPQVIGFTTQPNITLGGSPGGSITFDSGGALSMASPAQINFAIDWSGAVAGSGTPPPPPLSTTTTQTLTIDYGEPAVVGPPSSAASGSTQHAGTTLELGSVDDLTGQPPGSYQKASIDKDGYVIFTYSNGQQKKPYRIPLVTFNDADKLSRISGATFLGDNTNAGNPVAKWAAEGDAGKIVASSVEKSNVDLGEELTRLIVAQRAYSSNGKVISTSDQMIQEVINLKQ